MNKKNKFNILMIGSDLSVNGGIVSVVKQFLNHDWNEEVDIEYIPTYIDENIIKKSIFFIKSIYKIIYCLIKNNIDIVHIHMAHTGSFYRKYIVFRVSKLFNKKVIIHLHGSEFKRFFDNTDFISKRFIKYLIKNCDKILVLGERWANIIEEIEADANIKILLNSVNIPLEEDKKFKEKIDILFLGALVERKGIYDLLEVAKQMKEKELLDKYKIRFIIGGSGKEEKNFVKKINEYGISNYIVMKGWVNEEKRARLLKNSEIFILPSYNEGLPIAILEAMSHGLPVISTNVGSINEAVIENKNGFLVQPGMHNELENAILELAKNKELIKKYGKNSRMLVEEKFNENKYFENIKSIYQNLY